MAWVRAQLCKLQKRFTRLAAASDKVYQLLAVVGGSLRGFFCEIFLSNNFCSGAHEFTPIISGVRVAGS
jgi:hypothetical protein